MNQVRFRLGVALIALGGLLYVVASFVGGDELFAVAVALVGCGLVAHLSDPVIYRNAVAAVALTVAVGGAFADAALTASGSTGTGPAIATAVLIAGVAVTAMARRAAKQQQVA